MTKKVEEKAKEFNNDLVLVNKKIKSIQSQVCNLKKKKGLKNYQELLSQLRAEEDLLKDVKNLLNPKEKFVPDYDQEDVDRLDYDQTIKALKTIQSKKYHTRWLTDVEGDNDEFRQACKVEQMLNDHKSKIKPVDEQYIRKTDLVTIIDTIKTSGELSQERILELLESLL